MIEQKNIDAAALLRSTLGPDICKFLDDDAVGEVYINNDGWLWVKHLRKGKFLSDVHVSEEQSFLIIRAVAGAVGQIINEDKPSIGCEVYSLDCRFQGEIPPISIKPVFMIRKKSSVIFTMDQYLEQGFITETAVDYLRNAIKNRKNILVAGATDTGKTTFLNTLIQCVVDATPNDRILIFEDTPELKCTAKDFLPLKTNIMRDPEKSYTMQMLLAQDGLRLSPNRIILGEVRDGPAAVTMLKAWNTGHPGGFCTVHANSALEGLPRMEVLLYEDPTSRGDVRPLIGDAIDIVLNIRKEDFAGTGSKRYIESIIEVEKFDMQEQKYVTNVIYESPEVNRKKENSYEDQRKSETNQYKKSRRYRYINRYLAQRNELCRDVFWPWGYYRRGSMG